MPDGGIFMTIVRGLSPGQIAAYVILFANLLFWLYLVPAVIVAVTIGALYRAFFGFSAVTWRGVEKPDHVAELVLKVAAGDVPDEGDESGILRRMR
ncbi:MAG: hypothetical protein GXP25_11780 [Planctomycetes bacterium]|nr:hypothetical protein [Planctomycetota bacterium]